MKKDILLPYEPKTTQNLKKIKKIALKTLHVMKMFFQQNTQINTIPRFSTVIIAFQCTPVHRSEYSQCSIACRLPAQFCKPTVSPADFCFRLNRKLIIIIIIAPAGISPRRRNPEEALQKLARILRKVFTVEIYSHTINIETISICLNRGREESVGNDDVSIVCARKNEMVRMT